MNPHYQYATISGYYNAASKTIGEARTASTDPSEDEVKKEIGNAMLEEDTPKTKAPSVLDTPDTRTTTSTGDTSIPVKEGTTINIFNPDGMTSSTSTSRGVSIDADTGEFDTEATDPNAGNLPSGGGGGGGGGGGAMGGGNGAKKALKKKKKKKLWLWLLLAASAGAYYMYKK